MSEALLAVLRLQVGVNDIASILAIGSCIFGVHKVYFVYFSPMNQLDVALKLIKEIEDFMNRLSPERRISFDLHLQTTPDNIESVGNKPCVGSCKEVMQQIQILEERHTYFKAKAIEEGWIARFQPFRELLRSVKSLVRDLKGLHADVVTTTARARERSANRVDSSLPIDCTSMPQTREIVQCSNRGSVDITDQEHV